MKTIVLISAMLFSSFGMVFSQDYAWSFERNKNGDITLLSKKNSMQSILERATIRKNTYPLLFSENSEKRIRQDICQLLQKEFVDLPESEEDCLKSIVWYLTIYGDGKCYHDRFLIPSEEVLNKIPDLECHLSRLVQAIESMDFGKYEMENTNMGDQSDHIGQLMIPFKWME